MRLIVISSPHELVNEGSLINQLFQAGLEYFHLRKPDDGVEKIRKLLKEIEPDYYNLIALHQHHQLANEFGIKRLHYTETARKATDEIELERLVADGFTLITSVHDVEQLTELRCFDYAFYGPVFNSLSKQGYNSTLPSGFILNKSNIKTKIMAIGGIEAGNLQQVQAMGFDGCAVLGTIWNDAANAITTFKLLSNELVLLNG